MIERRMMEEENLPVGFLSLSLFYPLTSIFRLFFVIVIRFLFLFLSPSFFPPLTSETAMTCGEKVSNFFWQLQTEKISTPLILLVSKQEKRSTTGRHSSVKLPLKQEQQKRADRTRISALISYQKNQREIRPQHESFCSMSSFYTFLGSLSLSSSSLTFLPLSSLTPIPFSLSFMFVDRKDIQSCS